VPIHVKHNDILLDKCPHLAYRENKIVISVEFA
jgi:hypothetical protein